MKRCPKSGASVVTRPDDCVVIGIPSLSRRFALSLVLALSCSVCTPDMLLTWSPRHPTHYLVDSTLADCRYPGDSFRPLCPMSVPSDIFGSHCTASLIYRVPFGLLLVRYIHLSVLCTLMSALLYPYVRFLVVFA